MQKLIRFLIYLIVLSLPLYLVKFNLWNIPFTLLEALIYFSFIVWLIYRARIQFTNLSFQRKRESSKYRYFLDSRFRGNDKLFIPILFIYLGVTFSTLFSNNIIISAGIWKGWFVAPILFLILFVNNIKTKKHIKNTIIFLMASGVAVSLTALYYWLVRQLTYDGRLASFYSSPNYLAMYLSPILILSLYLLFVVKNQIYKILFIIGYLLIIFIIYLTKSYGALSAVSAGILFLLFFLRNRADKRIILIISLLAVLSAVSIFWQIPTDKFQRMMDFSYPSLKSRLMIWQSAGAIIKDHPLIGIGPGMFQEYYLAYQPKFEPYLEWAVPQPHNLFLAFWLQTGLFGLIGFIYLIIIFFIKSVSVFFVIPAKAGIQNLSDNEKLRYSLDSRFRGNDNEGQVNKIFVIILAAAMFCILVHGLVDTPYWKNDLSMIFWLIVSLNYTAGRLFYFQKQDNPQNC